MLGERGRPVLAIIDIVSHAFFGIVAIIMKAAPIGAFGAMAFTIGKYGVGTLLSLAQLMIAFYVTCLIFVVFVLGTIAWFAGFNILKFIKYIKEELLIVLGTSSSESVLPRMIAKLENLGCKQSVVGLVVPTGYSFNLDGTCIYLTMAAIFLAQATNTELTMWQQLGIIGVLLLTSKGAAGVTGSGFIVLAATLASVGTIPVASIALILGVDRFMSEARALTNLVGNGVATVVVAKWENALDEDRMRRMLDHETETRSVRARRSRWGRLSRCCRRHRPATRHPERSAGGDHVDASAGLHRASGRHARCRVAQPGSRAAIGPTTSRSPPPRPAVRTTSMARASPGS